MTFDPHASELARIRREALGQSAPPPNSLEELAALDAIDEARAQERDELTGRAARRRRRAQARHWSDRSAHV